MGLIDRLMGRRPEQHYQAVAMTLPDRTANKPTWPTWDPAVAARDGYAKLALIYRCVNIVAHALGTATVRVYDEANDNETIPDHPMRKLMRRPNPQMGEAAFWANVGTRAAIAGFCVVEKERNRLGDVIGLWPLQSTWLRAIPRRDSGPDWEYRIPGITDPFRLKAEDVVVFKWADTPMGSPYGQGPVEACLREITMSNQMTDFVKVFFENGAVPLQGLILDVQPGMTVNQEQNDAILDAFVMRRGGLRNAWRPMAMTGVKDIKRLGFDFNELAYTDLRDISELAITTAFGIPPGLVGTRVGLERNTFSNAREMRASFYEDTIIPLWARFDDALTLQLLNDFEEQPNISLEFDTSKISALQEDRNAKAIWVIDGFRSGLFSAHLAHTELGFKTPEGDDYYLRGIATTTVPATDPLGLSAEPDVPAIPPPNSLAMLSATTSGEGASVRMARAGTDRKRIARVAEATQPSIRRFFREQGQRLVPTVTSGLSGHGPTEMYDAAEIDWDDEDKRLRKVIVNLYLMAGEAAFDAITDTWGIDIGISFDLANPRVGRVVDRLARRVVDINATTRDDIARLVTKGLQDGKTTDEIATSLRGLFSETYTNRAVTIARTESMISYGHASTLGFRESGVVDRIQCFDNETHTESYPGAIDGLTCAERNLFVDTLDSAELHLESEHVNGSLTLAPVLIGESV
jgi:HK97 family phage portal protein